MSPSSNKSCNVGFKLVLFSSDSVSVQIIAPKDTGTNCHDHTVIYAFFLHIYFEIDSPPPRPFSSHPPPPHPQSKRRNRTAVNIRARAFRSKMGSLAIFVGVCSVFVMVFPSASARINHLRIRDCSKSNILP